MKTFDEWLDEKHGSFVSLTKTTIGILENLLKNESIEYLAVTGRTKSIQEVKDKGKRKNYKDPKEDHTDISGTRIIVYFESDVKRVEDLINKSFHVDKKNSLNKDDLLAVDQMGYRSIHFVCDLGPKRVSVPEYQVFKGLRFEIQIRTVLQHAWAELSHDRNYKFGGTLPKAMERELYLYAGMLEIADKGFDKLASEIDAYAVLVQKRSQAGDLEIEINSVSLEQFVNSWSKDNGFHLEDQLGRDSSSIIVQELKDFGTSRLQELNRIIPKGFAAASKKVGYSTTLMGLVRDWMIIHDSERYRQRAWKNKWNGFADPSDSLIIQLYTELLGPQKARAVMRSFDEDIEEAFEN